MRASASRTANATHCRQCGFPRAACTRNLRTKHTETRRRPRPHSHSLPHKSSSASPASKITTVQLRSVQPNVSQDSLTLHASRHCSTVTELPLIVSRTLLNGQNSAGVRVTWLCRSQTGLSVGNNKEKTVLSKCSNTRTFFSEILK